MSIEGGARFGYVNPDADDLRLPARPARTRRRARPSTARRRGGRAWPPTPGAALRRRHAPRRRRHRAGGDVGHQPGHVGRRGRADPVARVGARGRARRPTARRWPTWASRRASRSRAPRSTWPSSARAPTRRLSDLRVAAEVAHEGQGGQGRARARGAGLAAGGQGRRGRGPARDLPGRGLRVAQGGLLDVPRHERRQAPGPRDERVLQQPQLHRAAGQPHRAHAADEPGHGRGGRASPAPSPTCGRCCDERRRDVRRADRGAGHSRPRQRHRHRPHHPGAVPQGSDLRGPGRARLRGRAQAGPRAPVQPEGLPGRLGAGGRA